MTDQDFISDPITPDPGTADISAMARAEPGLPTGFTWRGKHFQIQELLATWKANGTTAEARKYLRRHWFRVLTTTGETMTLYCLRQAPSGHKKHFHWWLYSIDSHQANSSGDQRAGAHASHP